MSLAPEWLTLMEVAKVLELTRVRVWQLIRDKKLEGHQVGRMWVVKPWVLREFIEKRGKEIRDGGIHNKENVGQIDSPVAGDRGSDTNDRPMQKGNVT